MLRLPELRLVTPSTAREASRILAGGPGAMAVAGGTDLYPNMKRRQVTPGVLVSLRRVEGMRAVVAGGALRLGASVTLAEVAGHPAVSARWPALARAAGLVASPPIRNAATIGGNLCVDTRCTFYNQTEPWRAAVGYCLKRDGASCQVAPGSKKCWALSSSDTAPVLISMDAEVTLVSPDGERRAPVAQLYADDGIRYLAKRPDEVLFEIRVPDRTGWRSTYRKLRRRGSIDFPILGVAAAVRLGRENVVEDVRLVLGAVHTHPVAAEEACGFLRGKRLDEEAIRRAAELAYKPAKPLDNADLAASWRKRMARIEVARALRELAGLPTGDLPQAAG